VLVTNAAERIVGPAARCTRELRACVGAEDAYETAKGRLASTLRDEAMRVLVMNGVPAAAREDIAQAVTLAVLGRIVDGSVETGFEDGYLAVAAKNRARDWHRESSGVYEKTESYDEDFLAAAGPDPYAVLELREEECDAQRLTDRVSLVLSRAPARYRQALVAVYLEGLPIDMLVEEELLRDAGDEIEGADAEIARRRRARARVDKLLQRARDWVRARVVSGRSTPPPPLGDEGGMR
jgi:DNA-directed RNA polymerase specialized sigma24 family protein